MCPRLGKTRGRGPFIFVVRARLGRDRLDQGIELWLEQDDFMVSEWNKSDA